MYGLAPMNTRTFILAVSTLLAACGVADDPVSGPETRSQALCDSQTANVLLDSDLDGMAYSVRGCDELVGDMLITGVETLPELPTLNISGTLYIRDTQLTDLSGLTSLQSVGGLVIEGNPDLTTIDLNIETVGDVSIRDNERLSTVELNSLTTVGDIHIRGNTPLAVFESSMTQVTGDFRIIRQAALSELSLDSLGEIQGTLELNGLTTLGMLNGFTALTTVGGDLLIMSNQTMTSIQFDSLETVGGSFGIAYHPLLSSIVGLGSLEQVGGTLALHNSPNLASFVGLENVSSVGSFAVSRTGAATMTGLSSLTTISNVLILDQLPLTVDDFQPLNATNIPEIYLTDLESIQTIAPLTPAEDGYLEIGGLSGLDSLSQLTTVRLRNLHIHRSQGFDFVDMANLEYVYDLEMQNLTGLDRVGLPALTSANSIDFSGNRPLTNLSGFDALTTVNNDFYINYNSQLTSLAGLENLRDVGDLFRVENDDNLTSVSQVTLNDAGRVWIRLNNDLAPCEVTEFLARMANQPGSTRTDGNTGTGVCQ